MSTASTHLARNLAALGLSPQALRETAPAEWRIDVEGDAVTAAWMANGAGGWVRLHSARDPLKEARDLVEAAVPDVGSRHAVLLLGAGLGFAADAIELIAPDTIILVAEPSATLAVGFMSRRDWTARIAAGRLCLFVGPDYAATGQAQRVLETCAGPVPVIVQPVIRRRHAEALVDAHAKVERLRFGWRANAEARARFAGPYLRNTLANLPALAAGADVAALAGCAAGRPVFVAAAGPSLDADVAALAALRSRALLICVDTAVAPLRRHGLVPDLVVSVDPAALNARNLRATWADERSWLVAEGSVDPGALAAFAGRVFYFRVADHHPWPWLRARGIDCGLLDAWGSVLVTAIDLALRIGGSPVVLWGADLAYSRGQTYCRHVPHEELWALQGLAPEDAWAATLAGDGVVTVADRRGEPVQSSRHLIEFSKGVLARLPGHAVVVNATDGGILDLPAADPALLARIADAPPLDATGVLRRCHEAGRRAAPARLVVDEPTRDTWQCDIADLDAATLPAVIELGTAVAVAMPPDCGPVVESPAVIAAVHAAIQRRPPPDWAKVVLTPANAAPVPPDALLAEARRALGLLLARVPTSARPRPAAALVLKRFGGTATPSTLIDVHRDGVEALRVLEQSVAHLATTLPLPGDPAFWPDWAFLPLLAPDAEARARPLPWGRPTMLRELRRDGDLETVARWLLLLAYARAEALGLARDGDPGSCLRADLLFVLYHCVASSDDDRPARIGVRGADGQVVHGVSAAIAPWQLARALTGLLRREETPPRADALPGIRIGWTHPAHADHPLAPFLDGAVRRVPAVDLHRSAGLPPSLNLCALDGSSVLATPYMSRRGFRLSADGVVEPDEVEWPLDINGVVVLDDGTRVGWGRDDAGQWRLAWWRGSHGRQVSLPHPCTRVAVTRDGRRLCCGSSVGVVTTVDAATGTVLADEPVGAGLPTRLPGGDLHVGSLRIGADGRLDRRSEGVSWTRRDGAWTAVPHGPEGPVWDAAACSACVGATVTALAHPHGDVVALDGPGGRAWLAVYAPRSLAWAGTTLVVANIDGEVLWLPGLADALMRE
ncbi:hypothetical protein TBR22_A08190 [Luteitalea sp. TBR-22]|uniref:6-hydroxymethylpterin diphosphokinase MptE-like protein n=1 Tax=Luteitalea sp. TBR-22 TaxID=2802971 RepID=UPI001AFA2712|nr:6-hydroxymethylpterin diphosphokinase MptE-like protein [Luteitalea sp. TBR-22]BCS31617.1 hypothetical protein TBR22_A08190 [Luteitalea sp. TBR-22]